MGPPEGATRAFPAGHHALKGTPFAETGHPILLPGNPLSGSVVMAAEPGAEKVVGVHVTGSVPWQASEAVMPAVDSVAEQLASRVSWMVSAAQPLTVGGALSGGGIRSASFSVGVLQAIAACGFFPMIDYLSTVSGGGYAGTALTW